MYRSRVKIERVSEQLDPDPRRVIPRFFGPGDEKRLRGIIERIRALDRSAVSDLLSSLQPPLVEAQLKAAEPAFPQFPHNSGT